MRDLVILAADKNIEAVLVGFLTRDGLCVRLGCGAFTFDPGPDIFVRPGDTDPRTHSLAHERLRRYQRSHRHALVALDAAWSGSPGKDRIQQDIVIHLTQSGWSRKRVAVIVFDPEIEVWLWLHSPHVAKALGFSDRPALERWLRDGGHWPEGQVKPQDPKEVIEEALRHTKRRRSSAIYQKIAARASTKTCVDPSFAEFRETIQRWFPRAD